MAILRRDTEAKRNYMLTTPVSRLIPAMALPTIASMMVSSLYNLADTAFVSTIGTLATGAVGINSSLDNIIMMAGSFLATGAASYISRLLGAKKDEKANQVMSTAFFTALFTGLLVLILGYCFMEPMLRLLGATDSILPYSRDYAVYVLLAAPIMAASFVLNQCLRAEGSAAYSMIGMIAGAIINIGLDPLFIFVFDWGVKGASAATAISKLISFIILLIPYIRRKSLLRISIRHIKYTVDIISEVLKMGSPSLLRNGLSTVAAIILNNMAAGYSESALAAISVVNRIVFFLVAISLGFGQGFQPVVGFSWGAGRYDRIIQSYRFSSIVGVVGMAVISLAVGIFAEPIISLFTKTDTELIRIGVFSMRVQCLATPIHTWVVVVNMLYAGLGKAGGAVLLGVSRQGICFFPLLPFLSFFGVYGVAAVQGVADALSIILAIPLAVKALRELRARMEKQQAAQPVTAAVPEALEE